MKTNLYPCTCNADQKEGFLKGIHNSGCRTLEAIYPEIWVSRRTQDRPVFPTTCPACGADATSIEEDQATYACGGSYEEKPQIQNHTDKWWGRCGG